MYLKEIIAHGFKSFADKISIDLNKDITGIVGPNGSGKSNVVDAVRWVLGEQSVKSLRGTDNMTDVIFSGSKSRNSLNVASVTLVFDNSDHYLPVAFDEVSIKRRVYRDGTNEYYLNGEKCRLKDITDVLLDSGIAKESFNIISQGKIEEILSSKPHERRIIFEEAAGVLKYKKRKEDALRKLEKTHNNMSRVEDIIGELETQVNPLKEQKEKALEYLDIKDELENIEVSLITKDITDINYNYQAKKDLIEKLNNEIITLVTNSSGNEAKISEYKLNIDKLNNEINDNNKKLLETISKVEKLNSRKTIILERQKYKLEDTKLHNNLIDLKETNLKLNNDLVNTKNIITIKEEELKGLNEKFSLQENLVIQSKNNRQVLEQTLTNKYRNQNILKTTIENLKDSVENNSLLPSSVRSVLNNPKLSGIHNVIGSLLEVDEKYSKAISTVLGFASNNIIVDDENSAKEAINYLKNNKLGRATFFPLSIIKPKAIEPEVINILKNSNGFIDIASNLIKFDKKYYNIFTNQLGNVIVVDNIDNANKISKKVNYRYRIVTIDGELLHIGGSITGGNVVNNKNVISIKYDLENTLKEYNSVLEEIKVLEDKININDSQLKSLEDTLYLINKDKMMCINELDTYNKSISELNMRLDDLTLEINSIQKQIDNNLSSEEEEILKEYYDALALKESLELTILSITKKRDELKDNLEQFEYSLKSENSLVNTKNKELKELEIEVNRMDVKLDTLLNTLNETYSMTYEKAKENYILDIEEDVARHKVSTLKRKMKDIGVVNLGAIEEYDRVSTRYEFLIGQKEDLIKAENTLLEIINEMDAVMEKEFVETFKIIQSNFKETFTELFNGGTASLKLTDPANVLETGIEIIASPPGKKLTTISLLSGGEKTFTAISLLFAILKSRPVPFCILDEVEAALDEVNVNSFGKYLKQLQQKTQFIVITHKKKTMEYADTLYGVTMQESGVSKLVSVKLEELK